MVKKRFALLRNNRILSDSPLLNISNERIILNIRVKISLRFSDIFPNDLPVGEVVNITDERGRFQKSVVVQINENIGSIINLFVIVDQ